MALVLLFGRSESTAPAVKKLTWITIQPEIRKLAKKEETKAQHRIVQTEAGKKTKDAPRDAYLGWQNQKVETQTTGKNKTTATGSHGKSNAHDLGLAALGFQKIPAPPSVRRDEPNWASPGNSPQDSLDGIKESDRTALNTREFAFYSYFQRIRERLDRAWVPLLRGKLITYYRSGRHLASSMEHTTRVLVVLNDRGEVIRLEILTESGNQILDEAAVGAFNQAGPFPNPPRGIIDQNREVRIPWDFILKS